MSETSSALDLLKDLIDCARRKGADAADGVLFRNASLSVARRLGAPERIERSESADLGLRVIIGRRQAVVSTTDIGPSALGELVDRAIAMARVVPEDPYCGLADPLQVRHPVPDLDILDPVEPTVDALTGRAAAAEDAARAVAGVSNSEGAEAGWSRSEIALAATNGFAGAYARSSSSVSVAVLAGSGTAMERDYDYSSAVHAADLMDPAAIGQSAGERAVRRLNARKAVTLKVPVVFDNRVAGSLVRHFAGAINGTAIARGTSFLKDKLGRQIFAPGLAIFDDPLRRRGLASRPFDGEGLEVRRRALIEDGVLTGWVLDLATARQLGLASTANAARGTSAPPSPGTSNLYLAAGRHTPAALIADIDRGFYVTEMMGFGVNSVTGDYSRGAAGFWIEKGQLAFPVSEVTIAGNLIDMFKNLVPADDLVFRYGVDSPTVRIDGMTVAGT